MSSCPLGLFWDLENCQLPSDKSALAVVQHFRSKFGDRGSEVEFVCVCDVNKERMEIIDQLNEAQVSVIHVTSGVKNAADEKLKACLQKFGHTYKSPATAILISGDVNFSYILNDLRYRCGFYVIVVHGWPVQDGLLATSNEHFRFQQLLQDVPPILHSSLPKKRCCYLRVCGLPSYAAPAKVKCRLRQLSDNLGGRVMELKRNGTAILQFASPQATLRAEKRMHNETVFGMKITVQTAHNTTLASITSPAPCIIPSPQPWLRLPSYCSAYNNCNTRFVYTQSPPPPLLPPSTFVSLAVDENIVASVDSPSSPVDNLSEHNQGSCSDLLESDTTESDNEMAPPSQRQIMTDKLKSLLSCNKAGQAKLCIDQSSRSQSSLKNDSDYTSMHTIRTSSALSNNATNQTRQSHQRYDNTPIDVRVDNLVVSNGHVRDMKKILWTKFAQFVQVRHVTIIPQTDGKWYALVQVSNQYNAQKAVQYMDKAKVNQSRIKVAILGSATKTEQPETDVLSLREEVISLLNELPTKCIQLKKLIQLLKCICDQPLTLTDLYQMRDAVRLAENRSGVCFIRLTSKFHSQSTPATNEALQPFEADACTNEGDMVLAEQIVEVLLTQEGEWIALDDLDQAFNHRFNSHIPLSTLRVNTVRELVLSIPNTVKLTRNPSGRSIVRLSDCRQKSIRVQKIFYLFLRKPEMEFTPENFARAFETEFGMDCDPDKLKDEFPELLTWKQKPQGVLLLRLTDLQQFALRSRRLLIEYSTRDVPLSLYQSEYQFRYGYTICPQKYGYPSLIGLLRAASHVLYLKGRGARSTITINRNFLASLLCLKDHVRIPQYPTPRAHNMLNRHKWVVSQQQDNWDEDVPSGVEQLDEETKTQLGFVFKRNNASIRRPCGRKMIRGGASRGQRGTQVWRRKTTQISIPRFQRLAQQQVDLLRSSSTDQLEDDDEETGENEQLFDVKLEDYEDGKVVEEMEEYVRERTEEFTVDKAESEEEEEEGVHFVHLLPPAYFGGSPMKDSGVGSIHDLESSPLSDEESLPQRNIKRATSKARWSMT